jgi:MFS family permease
MHSQEDSAPAGGGYQLAQQEEFLEHGGPQEQEEQIESEGALRAGLVPPCSPSQQEATRILVNFVFMAVLFSSNHGTIVACLSLSTARLGAVGAYQSGMLYLFYTSSAVLGATYVVKRLGGRNGMIMGMSLYCIYVGCFWVAAAFPNIQVTAALTGAAFGGLGAGFLWIAQGSYFTEASQRHARALAQDLSKSTSFLAGIFAFIYLALEVLIRLLSSVMIRFMGWREVFAIYAVIAIATSIMMLFVFNYPTEESHQLDDSISGIFFKATAAIQLLRQDPKMKYMIGLNAVFGFAGAFLNSYVNGEVVRVALNDNDSRYVGALTSWMALCAAVMSLFSSRISVKGPVLITGALCFFFVSFPFMFVEAPEWNLFGLLTIYSLQGVGRATFESTLKATFADYFSTETEGAFSNIILQNGLSGAIGYVLTFQLTCNKPSRYCVEFNDGSYHDVLTFEVIVCILAVLAILGYWRASVLKQREVAREIHNDIIVDPDVLGEG